MNEKMNGGISTMRGIFCRLPFQKGWITAETIAAQGFDGGIFSVDTRQAGMPPIRVAFLFCASLAADPARRSGGTALPPHGSAGGQKMSMCPHPALLPSL